MLRAGTLWQKVLERTDHAVRCGALERIPTRIERIGQDGVEFLVHVAGILERKRQAGRVQERTGANPFMPYEEDLFVADISETHLCLLNRFNVLDHHVLLVTRRFEEQESLLNLRDFEAMWIGLREYDGLAFYNAGTLAGASQPHKHLQQVPLPLGGGPERIPMDRVLVGAAPGLPFVHALAKLDPRSVASVSEAAGATLTLYRDMLRALGWEREPGPYNLLVTRDWMLLVPRRRETCGSLSVNALGFAGSLFVRNDTELALLRRWGPMSLLRHVSLGRR